ncbi:MAG: thiamine pyrophosphate-binding protein [Geminicoccaceae bacterium]
MRELDDGSNRMNGAEAMVRMLEAHGVRHVFGLCGDTSLPFYDALYQLDHDIDHILTRDERSAAYMADGYARVTGRVGVCEGPSGGGATYILPGVVEANESSIPVLAITTDVATTSAGRFPLTELDQEALFRPLTSHNAVIRDAALLPRMVRAAFKSMTTGRPGAAHLGVPFDVQKAPVDPGEIWADDALGRFPAKPTAPDPVAVERAASMLLNAQAPLVICGGGVVIAGAEEALARLVDQFDLPVATTISGQGSLAETHRACAGVVGSNGGIPEGRALIEASDLILFVGCRAGSVTTERWRFPKAEQKIIHIDSAPAVIGAAYPTEVALIGDARLALLGLGEALRGCIAEFDGKARAAAVMAARDRRLLENDETDKKPIRPERLIRAMNKLLPEDAVVVADPGTPCPYISAYWRQPARGRKFISNRAHGALGYALSAAIGAKIGRPDAPVLAVMGDGSFGFTCGELETVVRLDLPITFVVISNAVFGWIKAGQRSGFGERYFSVDFSRTDHAAVARAFGMEAHRIEDPREVETALARALASDRPVLLDLVCQPLHEAAAPVSEWVA